MRTNFLYSFVSFAILVIVGSAPAVAQDTSGGSTLEEIIVTAQFREESLQDAGLALDVLTGADLAKKGVSSGLALSDVSPGLTVLGTGGTSVNIVLRGVGNRSVGSNTDQAVIFNHDGVALERGGAAYNSMYDLERVEILKGPQGTLYGRNTTGGVINIVPVKPQLGEFGGFLNGSYGNYDALDFSAAVNAPLGDAAALRISGKFLERDGFNDDGTDDVERSNIRGQLLVEPTDRLSIRVAADYGDVGGTGPSTTPYATYMHNGPGDYPATLLGLPVNSGPYSSATGAFRSGVLSGPAFIFQGPITDDLYIDQETLTVSAEIIAEFDAGTLTIIPAYSETDTDASLATSGFKLIRQVSDSEQKSIEARFAGSAGMVDYIIGAHYVDEDIDTSTTINLHSVVPIQNPVYSNEAAAGFAELTFNLRDTTRLIAGGRYTQDDKTYESDNDTVLLQCGNFPVVTTPPASFFEPFACHVPGNLPVLPTMVESSADEYVDFLTAGGWIHPEVLIPLGPTLRVYPLLNNRGNVLTVSQSVQGSRKSSEPTYRFSLEQDLFDDSLLYATFARGYRAGGFDSTGRDYEPEFLDAFTIGMKNTLLGNTLQLNAELFWWDFQDQQITFNTVNAVGAAEAQTQNVGAATVRGVEIDAIWLATENTLISTTIQYLDATFDDLHFLQPVGGGADNTNCPFVDTGAVTTGPTGGAAILDFDCSGNDSVFSPTWDISFAVEQVFPLSNGYQIVAGVDTRYLGSQQSGFFNRPVERIDSQSRTNVNVTLEPNDGDWFVSVFARNLENKNRVKVALSPIDNVSYATPGIDRTYGVRAGVNF